jgi:microfibrillar-associated protein 1
VREAARLARDRTERGEADAEKAEVERRRALSDAEIIAENRRLGIGKKEAKGDMRFMQKYFHRGAFYQVRACASIL